VESFPQMNSLEQLIHSSRDGNGNAVQHEEKRILSENLVRLRRLEEEVSTIVCFARLI
jgi:hypothetical protein